MYWRGCIHVSRFSWFHLILVAGADGGECMESETEVIAVGGAEMAAMEV